MAEKHDYDVAIVGGSIAGCATATMLGRRGARVALLEAHADPGAYKTICTHFIQPSATPTIERLGIAAEIEAAGGIRNGVEMWSRYGWILPVPDASYHHPHYGFSIRREKLDPMLRELAASTAGVDFMPGTRATGLLREGERVTGVEARDADGNELSLHTRLVVGADGRGSRVAELAALEGKPKVNERFVYFAYYRNLELASGTRSLFWFMDPEIAYGFPNDDGVTIMAAFPTRKHLPAFKQDLEGSFVRYFEGLPRAPRLADAERISKMLGKLDMPNIYRPPVGRGVALVGDAAMAADPLWGVGCGWAFQSAEWLAEETANAITGGADMDAALGRYRRRHRRSLAGHYRLICDSSRGRPLNPMQRLMFKAGVRDHQTALLFHSFGSRSIGPARLFAPAPMARMLRAALAPPRNEAQAPS